MSTRKARPWSPADRERRPNPTWRVCTRTVSGRPCRRRRDVAVRRPISRAGDAYRIRLHDAAREALRTLCGELRRLLVNENPATDSAVARLFPPAYPEDPLRNLD